MDTHRNFFGTDEGYFGPVDLGFGFKFYGNSKTQIYFSTNGFLSFVPLTANSFTNATIPTAAAPNEIIAPFWDDLDGKTIGKVYYKQDGSKFIVQYDNWQRYSGTASYTFQVVLYSSGKIMIYYNNMSGTLNSATVGIENNNGSDGLLIAYNANYAANSLALQIAAEPEWMLSAPAAGMLYNGSSVIIELSFTSNDLELGNYSMDMVIASNDPLSPEITVPVQMVVSSEIPVELTSFDAELNSSAVTLSWSTATETNNRGFEIERTAAGNWETIAFIEGKGTTTEKSVYSFTDDLSGVSGSQLKYRLKQIDLDGTFVYSNEVEINVVPTEYRLEQNYPIPLIRLPQ